MKKLIRSGILMFLLTTVVGCGGSEKTPPKEDKYYTITFKDETGTVLKEETYKEGSSISYEYDKTDTDQYDYSFEGWSTSMNGDVIVLPQVSNDATYYAVITKDVKEYSVTFNSNGGSNVTTIREDYGTSVAKPQDPTKTGFTFTGWYYDGATNNAVVWPITLTGNVNLHAGWVADGPNEYSITFNSNGGSAVTTITDVEGASIDKPQDPTKADYSFVAWYYDEGLNNRVEWPITLTRNVNLYAAWNQKINLRAYFDIMTSAFNTSPMSFIPDNMKPGEDTYVNASSLVSNFSSFVDVEDIQNGYGEQWNMVIDNLQQSQMFYNVLGVSESIINTSIVLFNNYFDSNSSSDANHTLNESLYSAHVDFSDGVFTYAIKFSSGITIPVLGEVNAEIYMMYDIETNERGVRISLGDIGTLKYVVTDDSYSFGLSYGINNVKRDAYFEIFEDDDMTIGHIYEFVNVLGSDLVASCADFYIDDDYVTVVGNKASGMTGFTGYINELYDVDHGKLLGYEIEETLLAVTYHTLWFNLSDIEGINSVKMLDHQYGDEKNPNDAYINGKSSIFTPTYNTVPFVGTKLSRRYDIELRKQYFYALDAGEVVSYEVETPMLFIQEEDLESFESDIKKDNNVDSSILLPEVFLNKIILDHGTYISVFKNNKELVTSEIIEAYIGEGYNFE